MRPLAEWQPGRIRGLLFDIDDTLTTHGKLTAAAYAAMERLKADLHKADRALAADLAKQIAPLLP